MLCNASKANSSSEVSATISPVSTLQESLSKFRPIILGTYDLCLCHLSENMSDRHSTYAKA